MKVLFAALTASAVQAFNNNQGQTFGIASWDMSLLNYYVVPGILAGLAVFFFILLIFLFATCQLMSVQAPAYFVDKSIDFGKTEEVE